MPQVLYIPSNSGTLGETGVYRHTKEHNFYSRLDIVLRPRNWLNTVWVKMHPKNCMGAAILTVSLGDSLQLFVQMLSIAARSG